MVNSCLLVQSLSLLNIATFSSGFAECLCDACSAVRHLRIRESLGLGDVYFCMPEPSEDLVLTMIPCTGHLAQRRRFDQERLWAVCYQERWCSLMVEVAVRLELKQLPDEFKEQRN